MEPETNSNMSLIIRVATGVVAVLLVGGVGVYLSQEKNKKEEASKEITQDEVTPAPNEPVSPSVTQTKPLTEATVKNDYKDGTYTATGTYTSPAGAETVSVSLTIINDTVTSSTFKGNAEHPASKKWQGEFSKGFTTVVNGKDIDTLSLTIVNGSSLTPKGFMNALAVIKTEAKI